MCLFQQVGGGAHHHLDFPSRKQTFQILSILKQLNMVFKTITFILVFKFVIVPLDLSMFGIQTLGEFSINFLDMMDQ